MNPWKKFVITISASLLAGALGSLFTSSAIPNWYADLPKPALTPPSWVFAPVWTTLYVLMGTAAGLIWKRGVNTPSVRRSLWLFAAQLVLNSLWSMLFFGIKDISAALIEITILWVTIFATILAFSRVSKLAAGLMLPYLLWVSFATYLTYSFWIITR